MSKSYLFTSESVAEGHPDKIADQVSDAILDAILAQEPKSRVACETMTKTGMVIVAGEITTNAVIEVEHIVRKTVLNIGYDHSDKGFDGTTCAVLNGLGKQSQDIAQGVDRKAPEEQGAGDQGLMFGLACDETPELMPLPITLAHQLVERLASERRSGKYPFLRPDSKSQVTVQYREGKPVRVDAVVISTQHGEDVTYDAVRS